LSLHEFLRALRTRWLIITVSVLIGLIAAVLATLLTTPLYQASTRLFVSSTGGQSIADSYQGNRLSQERVASYTEIIRGETLAQRTIDKLNLDMTAGALSAKVQATSKLETVLINVNVTDESPVRARDLANAMSDEFVVMVRELETPAPGSRPDARVVVEQRASIPNSPVTPKKVRNIAAGLAAGLALGIGFALLREMLDNTVKDRETLEQITQVGMVGSVPLDKDRREKPAISFDTDNTLIAEAFRKIRTNLQFLSVDNPPRVIVVTSSAPSEGKTTTAINIALALAEAEHSVVLVDGDMRRPSLAKYLDLVSSVGFSTVLSGAASLADVLQQTKYPHLTVLAAGPTPPNPSELLGSQAARKVLQELRSQFDYVVIDSSPLLAVTDGAIIATHADGTLLISRFGQTKRDQLAHAAGILNDVGAALLGAVVTMTPTRGGSTYSYSYHYSYYGENGNGPGGSEATRSAGELDQSASPATGLPPTALSDENTSARLSADRSTD
jgi:capsular exopolysaccharide synthesis family protein